MWVLENVIECDLSAAYANTYISGYICIDNLESVSYEWTITYINSSPYYWENEQSIEYALNDKQLHDFTVYVKFNKSHNVGLLQIAK